MIRDMEGLFNNTLQDIYFAEKHLVKAIRKLARAATNSQLKKAFEDHLLQTETHVERLEKVFELMGKRARGKRCEAIIGITEEADEALEETTDTEVRDAALIAAAQAAEHYEIARYGTLCAWAEQIGLTQVKEILGETLDEEEKCDKLLSNIAYGGVNQAAIDAQMAAGKAA